MGLLRLALIWLAEQPNSDKYQETRGSHSDTSDPWVCASDDKTSRPLIVGKMSDSNCALLKDIGQERSLVIDQEVEDSMLIWQLEARAEDGAVRGPRGCRQWESVKRREHAEFELNGIARRWNERLVMVDLVLGQLYEVRLYVVGW